MRTYLQLNYVDNIVINLRTREIEMLIGSKYENPVKYKWNYLDFEAIFRGKILRIDKSTLEEVECALKDSNKSKAVRKEEKKESRDAALREVLVAQDNN